MTKQTNEARVRAIFEPGVEWTTKEAQAMLADIPPSSVSWHLNDLCKRHKRALEVSRRVGRMFVYRLREAKLIGPVRSIADPGLSPVEEAMIAEHALTLALRRYVSAAVRAGTIQGGASRGG